MEGGLISECANSYAISSIRILHLHLCISGLVSSVVSQLRLVKSIYIYFFHMILQMTLLHSSLLIIIN